MMLQNFLQKAIDLLPSSVNSPSKTSKLSSVSPFLSIKTEEIADLRRDTRYSF